MPGKQYPPAGKWIYERASRLRKKNPEMEESTSFAIATQQAHKVGKSPKGFRTAGGMREAKAKMTGPVKEYRKTAALAGFFDEMEKDAGLKMKALKFLAGYLIAKKLFGLGQPKEKKMSKGEMRAMQMGMQMGAQSTGARGGITRSMEAEIAPFERSMSRIESDLRKHAAKDEKKPWYKKPPPLPLALAGAAYGGQNLVKLVGEDLLKKEVGPAARVAGAAGGVAVHEGLRHLRKKLDAKKEREKAAAMGVDLRLKGPGGIQRPPFPTEGSKGLALKQFKQSRKIGQTMAVKPPEPNIRSVTSLPG
ncbi:MAG: hypothetical protein ACYSWU_23985 [Planctomycetota bacterium]|jgi:hypothetical protein